MSKQICIQKFIKIQMAAINLRRQLQLGTRQETERGMGSSWGGGTPADASHAAGAGAEAGAEHLRHLRLRLTNNLA